MKLTNKFGLPDAIVRAVAADDYDNGGADASVTTLLKPPRMVALERRHEHELETDVSDRIWSLVGRIGHKILEKGSGATLTEHRLFTQCLGWKISGQMDLVNMRKISDYKFTTVWSGMNGLKKEWEQQTNLYRLLCVANGIEITELEIVAIYRDWQQRKSWTEPDYPKSQVEVFKVPMWAITSAEGFLESRVLLHQQARNGQLPECSDEEMWARPTRFAVKKNGAKRATRVYDTMAEAESNVKDGQTVELRPGSHVRCEGYCAVWEHCTQHRQYQYNNLPERTQEPAVA